MSNFRGVQGRTAPLGAAVAAVHAARARARAARRRRARRLLAVAAAAVDAPAAAGLRQQQRARARTRVRARVARRQARQARGGLGRVRRHRRHRAAGRGGRVLLRGAGAEPGGVRGGRRGRPAPRRRQLRRRRQPAVRVPALRQEVPLEEHAAAARERGVRRQGAGAPVPVLRLQGQAARQPGRAHPQAPPRRVVPVRHQQGAPQQEDLRLTPRHPTPRPYTHTKVDT